LFASPAPSSLSYFNCLTMLVMVAIRFPLNHEYELFLRLLADRVYAAKLRDSTDFKQWLLECAEQAGESATMQEFVDKLPS
jgi:hypothetical protein